MYYQKHHGSDGNGDDVGDNGGDGGDGGNLTMKSEAAMLTIVTMTKL